MPLLILVALLDVGLSATLNGVWVWLFPYFAEPSSFASGSALESPAVEAQLVGAWGFLGLFIVNALFNTALGEEFLFRGVLFPKMEGVFGKWDWVLPLTTLTSTFDQAALQSVLRRLYSLGLPLISVVCEGSENED